MFYLRKSLLVWRMEKVLLQLVFATTLGLVQQSFIFLDLLTTKVIRIGYIR